VSQPLPTADAHLREETVSSQELLRGSFLLAQRDQVRLPDGSLASREYVRHPGAVVVVAQLPDGRYVLVRQWRHPLGRVFTEFPAGKLDAGEPLLACAQRELREETGYQAREWAYAGCHAPTIAYSDERIHIWFARGLTLGPRQLDAGEFLEVFTATPAELLQACRDGRITDGKTLTGVLWLSQVLRGDWSLDWQATPDAIAP
jgi:ADP-ribose pyrophosphatase